MPQRLVALVLIVGLVGTGGVFAAWQLFSSFSEDAPSEQEVTRLIATGTPDGALTFQVPEGWASSGECENRRRDCVVLRYDGAEELTAQVMPPNPVEGTPIDVLLNPDTPAVSGMERLTIAGRDAVRVDGGAAGTLLAGRIRDGDDTAFLVSCPPTSAGTLACDAIAATLTLG